MTEKPVDDKKSLVRWIGRLRWQAALLALGLVLLHQWIEHAYLFFLPKWTHFWTQVLVYGLVGPLLAWLGLTSLRRQVAETEQAERRLRRSRDRLTQVNEHLEFLVEVERRLAEAEDEADLIEAILDLPHDVVPAIGTSLIRFDEEKQPLPADHRGLLPPEEFEAWTAHLATPAAGNSCAGCSALRSSAEVPCPVLAGAPVDLRTERVYCLPLTRGDREFGVLTIYLRESDWPTMEEQGLLGTMAAGMSLALESEQLRSKELSALHRLQQVHELEGLDQQLGEVLANTIRALELDGGAVFLTAESGEGLDQVAIVAGAGGPGDQFLRGFAASVREIATPITVGELELAQQPAGVKSLVVAPLRKEERWLGSLLLWTRDPVPVTKRYLRVIDSVASQASLLVDSHRLFREAEYRAGLEERNRLAREIHDGLAQTLGYLKLRTTQLTRWLQAGAAERALQGIDEIRRLLDEAYVDAREAIDGLRADPGATQLETWLQQVYQEFEVLSNVRVIPSAVPEVDLPPEVRAQLLRIIQEALGNIRKHANAEHAWIDWELDDHWLQFRIRDDGCGFDPADVPPISRHGLRIMRERAELLGADFQIASGDGQGTEVVVRLPLQELEEAGRHG